MTKNIHDSGWVSVIMFPHLSRRNIKPTIQETDKKLWNKAQIFTILIGKSTISMDTFP